MKKKEFLDLLRLYLNELPWVVVNDILEDYEEHFEFGLSNGKTEQQICQELGQPEIIAKEYLNNENNKLKNVNKSKELKDEDQTLIKKLLYVLGILFFIVFLAPSLIGLIAGAFGLLVSLAVTIFLLGISAIAIGIIVPLSISPFILASGIVNVPYFITSLNPITKILLAITSILIGMVIFKYGVGFIRWLFINIRKLIMAIIWELKKIGDKI